MVHRYLHLSIRRHGHLCIRDRYFLGRGLDAQGNDIVFVDRTSPEGYETIGSISIDHSLPAVTLRVSSHDGLTYDFACSTDGGKQFDTVAEGVDARHTSTAAAGGFTGTTVGPYATSMRNSH